MRRLGVVAWVVLLMACQAASPGISQSPSTTADPSAIPSTDSITASPGPSTTPPEPTAATSELAWTETASFRDANGPAVVNDVVLSDHGLVAVGVQYEGSLPILGPSPPHHGRIWLSGDGRVWEDSTPDDAFTNVVLESVFVTANGSVVAVGTPSATDEYGLLEPIGGTAAWESTDGRSWTRVASGLPEGSRVADLAQGSRGYLAHLYPPGSTGGSELWFSLDGRTWERVQSLSDASVHIGAGAEGFVVVGVIGPSGDTPEAFAIASGDGRDWFEASNPPADAVHIAPLGADWVVASFDYGGNALGGRMLTWFSANGLDWGEHGEVVLDSVPIEGATCFEIPGRLVAGGPWLVMGTILSFPCSEGGLVIHGTQRISVDGASWVALPFERGAPGTESGSAVHASAIVDGRLVLVGETNQAATFWLGEAP